MPFKITFPLTRDITKVVNLTFTDPEIGDHKLIVCTINVTSINSPPKSVIKQCSKNYNKNVLCSGLAMCDFNVNIGDVQDYWNHMENNLIRVIDIAAPLTDFTNNCTTQTHPSEKLKTKIYKVSTEWYIQC